MKTIVPDYYKSFKCIASRCPHTCCQGWEIDIDNKKLDDYLKNPLIKEHIEFGEAPHFKLTDNERCPFLDGSNLCLLIDTYGEDILCDICRDHPRFRNYFSDRIEMGLGLVCPEAARIILSKETPMKFAILDDDGGTESLSEEEEYLLSVRDGMLNGITETGIKARLLEYLIYRHLPDALYDDRLEERIGFVNRSYEEIINLWNRTDGSLKALTEIVYKWSYDVEYDDEELQKRING